MAANLPVLNGITAPKVTHIPEDWDREWFRSFIKNYLQPADTRNATAGVGVTITGNITQPATIALNDTILNLQHEPYLLAAAPTDSTLTAWRQLVGQTGVISVTDNGATHPFTVGVTANGIGAPQFRQSVGLSVVGNPLGGPSNVTDIVAGSDSTVLQRSGGSLNFGAVPLAAIAPQANNTVLGNVSGGVATPTALSATQLTTLINAFTATLSGAVPASGGGTTNFLRADGAWAAPAYPTAANPSGLIGLAAVNGVATTFTRSDATHAIDQSIAPTWTGSHTFTQLLSTKAITIGAPASGASLTIGSAQLQSLILNGAAGTNVFSSVVAATGQAAGTAVVAGGQTFAVSDAFFAQASGGDGLIGVRAANILNLVTNSVNRVAIAAAGGVTVNAPTSGDAVTVSNVPGANALVVNGNAAGTAVIRVNTQATTGAKTASFTASNKPGTNNKTSPDKWIPVNVDGVSGSIPWFQD